MSANMTHLLFFFTIFTSLLIPSFSENTNSTDILYEVDPFIRVYKNGSIERLSGTKTIPPSFNPRSRVLSKDIIIEPTLNISARVFRPKPTALRRKLPLLLYFHGGAFFTESPSSPTYHNYLTSVVAMANVVAVSVNYRLAPEHPLPIAYQDSYLALKWVFNASWIRNHVDFRHVFLAGDSAGGNIAHNVAMRVGLENTGIKIHGLFLNCPHFWGSARIGNEASYPREMIDVVEGIWIHAYPNSTGFDDPMSNPGMDRNLGKLGCEMVLVYVAENDVLKDRGLDYVKVLKKSGWRGDVKGVEVKGETHVFNLVYPDRKDAKEMMKHVALFLNHRSKF